MHRDNVLKKFTMFLSAEGKVRVFVMGYEDGARDYKSGEAGAL